MSHEHTWTLSVLGSGLLSHWINCKFVGILAAIIVANTALSVCDKGWWGCLETDQQDPTCPLEFEKDPLRSDQKPSGSGNAFLLFVHPTVPVSQTWTVYRCVTGSVCRESLHWFCPVDGSHCQQPTNSPSSLSSYSIIIINNNNLHIPKHTEAVFGFEPLGTTSGTSAGAVWGHYAFQWWSQLTSILCFFSHVLLQRIHTLDSAVNFNIF